MFKVTSYPQGTFCWADCVSTNSEVAKKFYAAVMGWAMDDQPMGDGLVYTMYMQDGETVAGLGPMMPDMQAAGIPSIWYAYIDVDDVDSFVDKIKELGGEIVAGPFDVFDAGRMLTLKDPSGAVVSLWQAKDHIGASLINTPGAMTWNELVTTDVQAAVDFFGALLGWTFEDGNVPGYKFIFNNGRMNGGIMPMDESFAGIPPHWMNYFSVENIEAALEAVKSNGGKVNSDIIEIPNTGRMAVIEDPAGAHLTIIQPVNPQPAWTS